ncbi:hypothetical protein HDU79_005760 [Rhizoclosmatium sp. JEL0117]|nr:hypothetical protein HDU79_005760 [Rhizoclosmatium sp. JEL0117]
MATLDGSFPSATQLAVSTGTAPLAPPTVSVGDLLNASQSPSQGGGGLKADSNDGNYTTRTSTNGKRSRKPTATASPTVDSAAEREILINQVLDLQENVKGEVFDSV